MTYTRTREYDLVTLEKWRFLAWPNDEQRVESRIANKPVQVRIYQGETRASTPVTEQTRFDIVKSQVSLEQNVIIEENHG